MSIQDGPAGRERRGGASRTARPSRPQRRRAARRLLATYQPAGDEGIGSLELTRPEKLNATDDVMLADLAHAATEASADRTARAILVSGQGRAFSTGIDLAAFAAGRMPKNWFRRWEETLARIEAIEVPTVAVIRGPCLGGGLQLTLCCDLRVAANDATFALSAVKHGIIPGLATYRLPRFVGMGAARELMLLGETWDAQRALRHGLVDKVVAGARLDKTAREVALRLAGVVRSAAVATKRLTLRSYDMPLRRFLAEYVRAQRRCLGDPETRAMLERYRRTGWQGGRKS